jgi:hypothetical protein
MTRLGEDPPRSAAAAPYEKRRPQRSEAVQQPIESLKS